MTKKVGRLRTSILTVNNTNTSDGVYYFTSDRNKLKIGQGNTINENVIVTIDPTNGISGSLIQATEIHISEMGGLVIAEQYQHDASTGVFVDLTTTMGAPVGAPSSYVVHSGAPTQTHSNAEVAIHDGSGYVYDIDGIQLDSQQFWASVGDNYMQTIEFIITKDSSDVALVPTSYTFQSHWRANLNTEIKIYYGADMPPLIMKAVTVPNTIL